MEKIENIETLIKETNIELNGNNNDFALKQSTLLISAISRLLGKFEDLCNKDKERAKDVLLIYIVKLNNLIDKIDINND